MEERLAATFSGDGSDTVGSGRGTPGKGSNDATAVAMRIEDCPQCPQEFLVGT